MSNSKSLRILALEPFYGGSHRAFLDGWARNSRHTWTILGLPDRSWKWRMRHAPLTFAKQIRQQIEAGEAWDVLFCSDMLSLTELRGLAPPDIAGLPALVYFHENQLTYPVREESERDLHFAFTNLTTAFAAEAVWFNSEFHRKDFLQAAEAFVCRLPDYQPVEMVNAIRKKSSVQYPGIDLPQPRAERMDGPLHIVWAARWEHDKNPADFFAALDGLASEGVDFRVTVLGESFQEVPPEFAEYRAKLADKIVHWGYQASRTAYFDALGSADVFVSTAHHEFFGLAAVEAMAAGCIPVLPRRLAYPELVTDESQTHEDFLYDGTVEGLVRRLARLSPQPHNGAAAARLAQRFDWQVRSAKLDDALESIC